MSAAAVPTSGLSASTPSAAHRQAPLHRPRRALVAVVELLVVAVLVAFAVWCWQRGTTGVEFLVQGSAPPLAATRYQGNWIGGAIGLFGLAGFVVLDALRQLILGVRARPRRQRKSDGNRDPLRDDEV